MVVAAVMVWFNVKAGFGIQLTWLAFTEIETVTAVPAGALASDGGVSVTVVPLMDAAESCELTWAITPCEFAEGRIAIRAPSRDALIMTCLTITARPTSIIPMVNITMSGPTIANSTTAAPTRLIGDVRFVLVRSVRQFRIVLSDMMRSLYSRQCKRYRANKTGE